jgi:hypothetical protein
VGNSLLGALPGLSLLILVLTDVCTTGDVDSFTPVPIVATGVAAVVSSALTKSLTTGFAVVVSLALTETVTMGVATVASPALT